MAHITYKEPISITHPELAAEWHPTKNGDLKPKDVTAGCKKKVWWVYHYDDPHTGKHFDFEWEAIIKDRTIKGTGCPFLSIPSKLVFEGFNDLATTHPELVAEWHPTKNGGLKPTDVTAGNKTKVWWIYPYDDPRTGKHFDFEWEAIIKDRTIKDSGCPFLSTPAKLVQKGFNDLATTHPELVAEWHPTKNGDLKPTDVTAGNKTKVWWICEKSHNWNAIIKDRTIKDSGCPYCSESKGEKRIETVLLNFDIEYKAQYKIPDRKLDGLLRDDFAIFSNGVLVATIEYNGKQHYEPVDFSGKGSELAKQEFALTQERDKAKSEYLMKHSIPQLIIPYWNFEETDVIVEKFLQELKLI